MDNKEALGGTRRLAKVAVQCLNDPDSYRDSALYQVLWWQKV